MIYVTLTQGRSNCAIQLVDKKSRREAIYTISYRFVLFVCLVFNGTSTQDRSIFANCERMKQTQVAKDGQRETMHNS